MPLEERDCARFRDMEIYAQRAIDYLAEVPETSFAGDTLIQDAVLRCFEVLGEAARAVSPAGKAAYPAIPWPFIVGMRNRVIHEYHRIDLALVYTTVMSELPGLIDLLRQALSSVNHDDAEC